MKASELQTKLDSIESGLRKHRNLLREFSANIKKRAETINNFSSEIKKRA